MKEPVGRRLRRRIVTIPSMLAATAVAWIGAPVLAPVLAISDLIRGRRRLPRLRVYLFALQYLFNDTVEILAAPVLWVLGRFGLRLGARRSLDRHRRLLSWSAETLVGRADQLLGLRMALDDLASDQLRPGPVVAISRHVSPVDALLPGIVLSRHGYETRAVIMAELLADPGFDLIYGRTGSVFIPRHDGAAAKKAIGEMADAARRQDGANAAVVIFPEGRLFRPDVRDRALARLADLDPDRAARLAQLHRVLPPQPSGLRLLLESLPEADVLLFDHRGLDRLASLTELATTAPLGESIAVSVRRIARSTIPDEPEAFARWLDELWLELDAGLDESDGCEL